jgi:hypothetical protein
VAVDLVSNERVAVALRREVIQTGTLIVLHIPTLSELLMIGLVPSPNQLRLPLGDQLPLPFGDC